MYCLTILLVANPAIQVWLYAPTLQARLLNYNIIITTAMYVWLLRVMMFHDDQES